MSTINTNSLDVNYPVPGINNNSQGFRDNFASIKTNLNTAANEITDLQNKVVVKQALNNSTLNNDLANTLMSNVSTRSFRATTYPLGNDLSGTVLIDVSLGDVQIGTVTGNVILQFGSWAPSGTQSNVQLSLNIANADAVISFPSALSQTENSGVTTLENYANIANVATVTAPNNVTTLNYVISTTDCGTTLNINPTNRPRIAAQVQQRTPSPVGFNGDVKGDICMDSSYSYFCTADYDAIATQKTVTGTTVTTNEVALNNVSSLSANQPIVFTGNAFVSNSFGGIHPNQTYFIKTIVGGNSAITVSATRTAGTADAAVTLSTATPGLGTSIYSTSYAGTSIWKRIALTTW